MDMDRTGLLRARWEEILSGVREASNIATQVAYDTWLKPLEVASYINDDLTIYIPEGLESLTDYMNRQFALHIKVLCAECVGASTLPEIEFMLKPEAAAASEIQPAVRDTKPLRQDTSFLNPRYRFDSFVVGNNNNMAHAASLAVAESPGTSYNPLFLYGGPGLGKTHLMHSIAHMILDNDPSTKVLYVTCEQFTNDYIDSLRQSKMQADKMPQLREKYRTVDVLMIDDVQFLKGKGGMQEEFFHTFNELYQSGKQIVISSDRPPKEIETLEERLRSRFEWGLIADIQQPNYETRMAILRKNAEEDDCPYTIDDEVFGYIAENITSNIRELEGAFRKITAYARLHRTNIDEETGRLALNDIIDPTQNKSLTIDRIIDTVCEYYQLSREDIISTKRVAEIVLPRQVAMYMCRTLLSNPLEEIGSHLGGKDHTTVMSGVNKIKTKMETDASLRKNVENIKKQLVPENMK